LLLMNKKSAPFDYAQGKHQHTSTLAPIRLRSGQALAHKKSSQIFLLRITHHQTAESSNHQIKSSHFFVTQEQSSAHQHLSTSLKAAHQQISTLKTSFAAKSYSFAELSPFNTSCVISSESLANNTPLPLS
jgi:hypothetical protein